ncbi:MAG: hypothetical protein QM768_16955 [Agriterribacter sp.]
MKRIEIYLYLFLLVGMLVSCASSSKRKTADYYHQNESTIKEIMQLYDQLYEQQPFSAGFSDRSFKYYLMEVSTDSVRYIYNTEKNKEVFYSTIFRFNYDTVKLKSLGEKIRDIKCLWLSKSTFYINDKPETVNFLSFKSVSSGKLFVENKYYILVFLKHPISSPDINARIEKGDLVKINDLVYYMIGSGFR